MSHSELLTTMEALLSREEARRDSQWRREAMHICGSLLGNTDLLSDEQRRRCYELFIAARRAKLAAA